MSSRRILALHLRALQRARRSLGADTKKADQMTKDHESRILALETKEQDHESRIAAIERVLNV